MSPSWRIRFKNGFTLLGRIAGSNGLNFKGVHADWVWVDEAQDMVTPVWFQGWVNWAPAGVNMPMRGYLKAIVSAAMAADMYTGKMLFTERDTARREQYGQQTVGETASGRVTFSKGNDHIVDADRCAYFVARSEMFAYAPEAMFPAMRVEGFGAGFDDRDPDRYCAPGYERGIGHA